jgi:ABC-2 type transport system permease protein
MNPMIRKETLQRMRERRGWILPSLYLVVLGAVVSFAYYVTTDQHTHGVQGWQIGVVLFISSAYTQLILLLLLAPVFSAGALTIEKEQRTLAGLLTSLLRSYQIWWGKSVASVMFVLLLLVAGLPVLSAVFAFGGVGLWEVGIVSLTTVIILASISAISLYWSSAFRRSVHATAVSYVTVVVLTVVTFIIFIVAESRHDGQAWQQLPVLVKLPLFFNPLFFMAAAFVPREQLYPEWVICVGVFSALGILSSILTVRNLRRSGEAA